MNQEKISINPTPPKGPFKHLDVVLLNLLNDLHKRMQMQNNKNQAHEPPQKT